MVIFYGNLAINKNLIFCFPLNFANNNYFFKFLPFRLLKILKMTSKL